MWNGQARTTPSTPASSSSTTGRIRISSRCCASSASPGSPPNMSFSLRCERTGLEYNGTSLEFAVRAAPQSVAALVPAHARGHPALQSRSDASCCSTATTRSRSAIPAQRNDYSRAFIERYIVPMGRAIWSAEADAMLAFPARFFVDFFDRHGFLPSTIARSGRRFAAAHANTCARCSQRSTADVRLSTPVCRCIRRTPTRSIVRTTRGRRRALRCACSSRVTAIRRSRCCSDADAGRARSARARFRTQPTKRCCTPMRRLLPRAPAGSRRVELPRCSPMPQQPVALTYDMNILQTLDAPVRFLVTLNHADAIDERKILAADRVSPSGVPACRRRRADAAPRNQRRCSALTTAAPTGATAFTKTASSARCAALEHFQRRLARRRAASSAKPVSLRWPSAVMSA